MSFVYFLSKFSHEAMVLELFLIAVLSLCLFGYFILKRRRYGVAKNNIPDQVVRAFLVEILSLAENYKHQLFGTSGQMPLSAGGANLSMSPEAAKALAATMAAAGQADTAAIKAQLAAAMGKQDELNKLIAQLNTEKSALEQKLKAAASGAPVAAGGGDAASKKALDEALAKIATLESKLAEYEIIEDDLANLKRYQQENKQLKASLEMARGGAAAPAPTAETAPPAAAAAPAPTPAPEPTPTPAPAPAEATPAPAPAPVEAASPLDTAEATRTEAAAAASLETLTAEATAAPVEAAPAAPSGASVEDPLQAAATAAAEATVAATPPAPTPEAAPAAPAAGGKSDSDLLSEFEKMLNS